MTQPLPSSSGVTEIPTTLLAAMPAPLPDDPRDLLIERLNEIARQADALLAQVQRIYAADTGFSQPQMVALAHDHVGQVVTNAANFAHHTAKLGPMFAAMAAVEEVQTYVPVLVSNAPKQKSADFLLDQHPSNTHPNAEDHSATSAT